MSVTFYLVLFLPGLHLFFLGTQHGMQSQAECHRVTTAPVAGQIAFVTAADCLVEDRGVKVTCFSFEQWNTGLGAILIKAR